MMYSPSQRAICYPEILYSGQHVVLIGRDFQVGYKTPEAGSLRPVHIIMRYVGPHLASPDVIELSRIMTHRNRADAPLVEIEIQIANNNMAAACWIDGNRLDPACDVRVVGNPLASIRTLHRQRALPAADQPFPRSSLHFGANRWPLWRSLRVAIVGCGRIGSMIANAMLSQGINDFVLVDQDRIEPGNLDGMDLVSDADLARPKVIALAEGMARLRTGIRVQAIQMAFPTAIALAAVTPADVLITAVDDDAARLHGSWLARRLGQIHLDVGTSGNRDGTSGGSDIRLILPHDRCLLCCGGVADTEAELEASTVSPSSARIRQPGNSGRALNSLAVNMGVRLLMDVVGGHWSGGSRWLRLQMEAHALLTAVILEPTLNQHRCPWCGPRSSMPA